MAAGDTKRGKEILLSATTSSLAAAGGIVGGPAGAVAGKFAGDTLNSVISSADQKDFKPKGVIKLMTTADDPGEIFDETVDLVETVLSEKGVEGEKSGKGGKD